MAEQDERINKEVAEEIIFYYQDLEDISCSCHCGNPPCGKCENQPSEEEYQQALDYLEKKENEMNKIIIELFPVTKEAVLVDNYFGHKLKDPLYKVLIKGKEKELLEEAKSLEKMDNEEEDELD